MRTIFVNGAEVRYETIVELESALVPSIIRAAKHRHGIHQKKLLKPAPKPRIPCRKSLAL